MRMVVGGHPAESTLIRRAAKERRAPGFLWAAAQLIRELPRTGFVCIQLSQPPVGSVHVKRHFKRKSGGARACALGYRVAHGRF